MQEENIIVPDDDDDDESEEILDPHEESVGVIHLLLCVWCSLKLHFGTKRCGDLLEKIIKRLQNRYAISSAEINEETLDAGISFGVMLSMLRHARVELIETIKDNAAVDMIDECIRLIQGFRESDDEEDDDSSPPAPAKPQLN